MQATNGKDGAQTIKVYVCAWHRNRGNEVCANSLRRPVQAINSAVVGWIQNNVLREDLVLDVLREVRRRLADQAESVDRELPRHRAEIQRLRLELDRLTAALASGDEKPGTIIKAIAERERKMAGLEAQVNAARIAPSAVKSQLRGLEKLARKRLGELRSLLESNPAEARKTLEAICDGALTFQPLSLADGRRRYRIAGRMATANVFTRLGSLPSTSPTGLGVLERHGCPVFQPNQFQGGRDNGLAAAQAARSTHRVSLGELTELANYRTPKEPLGDKRNAL